MRKPTHPGEILHHEYLVPLKLTQGAFAAHLGVEINALNRLIKGHTRVSPAMALRFGAARSTFRPPLTSGRRVRPLASCPGPSIVRGDHVSKIDEDDLVLLDTLEGPGAFSPGLTITPGSRARSESLFLYTMTTQST